ncbi:DUF4307 domain-containing protein [Actinokineospora iranica]|uniref:DUF4307 domain-containing protein n=1 Tax=Actinokineospora iranica TaxID=1271860 RepID=A0A1G6RC28_9PSEU|nr:DUF4307 domain-containing protein [Actinokineospora iranica]SDD02180.1 protein of unknown function [Actinokineospora iranica]
MTVAGRALPEGRYGSTRARRSPRTMLVLIVCGLLAGGAVTYLGYKNLGTAPIEAQRTAFSNQPDNRMELTFDVTRTTPERPAVCIVRVRGIDGTENGRKEVYIAPGEPSARVTTVIRGASEPVTADVFGCSYQVPAYLSTDQPPTG